MLKVTYTLIKYTIILLFIYSMYYHILEYTYTECILYI